MSDLNFSSTPVQDAAIPPRARGRSAAPESLHQNDASGSTGNETQSSPEPDLRTDEQKAQDERKSFWLADAARHQEAARAAASQAVAGAERIRLGSPVLIDGVVDPKTPRWFVGEPSLYQKYQAQHGEMAFKKTHGKVAQTAIRATLGMLAAGAVCGLIGLPALGIFVAFSGTMPLLVAGLRNETLDRKMAGVVKRAGTASVGGEKASAVINTLAAAVEASTTKTFEGLVSRAAFQEKLAELRREGKSPSLAVRNTAVRHRIR